MNHSSSPVAPCGAKGGQHRESRRCTASGKRQSCGRSGLAMQRPTESVNSTAGCTHQCTLHSAASSHLDVCGSSPHQVVDGLAPKPKLVGRRNKNLTLMYVVAVPMRWSMDSRRQARAASMAPKQAMISRSCLAGRQEEGRSEQRRLAISVMSTTRAWFAQHRHRHEG